MKIDVQIINYGDVKNSTLNLTITPTYSIEEKQILLKWPSIYCDALFKKMNQVYNITPHHMKDSPLMWNEMVYQLRLTSLPLSSANQILLCKTLYKTVSEYIRNWETKKWISEMPHDKMFTNKEWKQLFQ